MHGGKNDRGGGLYPPNGIRVKIEDQNYKDAEIENIADRNWRKKYIYINLHFLSMPKSKIHCKSIK